MNDDLQNLNFLSAARDGNARGEFTDAVVDYDHEIREGPYECHWRFELGHEFSRINPYHQMQMEPHIMLVWFNNYLMTQVETRYKGSIVWRGNIVKMILNLDGYLMSIDATGMANAVKCSFQYEDEDDPDNSGTLWTAWHANEWSLKNYGNWERAIEHNGTLKSTSDLIQTDSQDNPQAATDDDGDQITEPDNKASVTMERLGQPLLSIYEGEDGVGWMEFTAWGPQRLAERVLIGGEEFAYREVLLAGETEPSGNPLRLRKVPDDSMFVNVAWGDTTIGDNERKYTVTDEINRLLDVLRYQAETFGGNPVLWPLSIEWNDRPCVAGVESQSNVMKRLQELAELRDLSGNYYELIVRYDGGVTYRKLDRTPVYSLYPAPKGLTWAGSERRPTWDAVPGIYRVVDTSMLHRVPTTWIGNAVYRYSTARMRMGAERAEFGDEDYTVERLYAAMSAEISEYDRLIEDEI